MLVMFLKGLRPPSRGLFIEGVSARRHNEVVPVQSADAVRPPGDRYLPPLDEQRRMVSLLLGRATDSVRERQGAGEILKPKHALQLALAITLDDHPVRRLRRQ